MLTVTLGIALVALAGAASWRMADSWSANRAWKHLAARAVKVDMPFDREMVEGLPDPARRYFRYTIGEGVRLYHAAEIEMDGEIGLGGTLNPRYLAMHAHQIMASPHGLVWKMKAGSGLMRISGSDGFVGSRS